MRFEDLDTEVLEVVKSNLEATLDRGELLLGLCFEASRFTELEEREGIYYAMFCFLDENYKDNLSKYGDLPDLGTLTPLRVKVATHLINHISDILAKRNP